jgi:hypothetical protein
MCPAPAHGDAMVAINPNAGRLEERYQTTY